MPTFIQSAVNSLLIKAGQTDPALVSIFQEILDELDRLGNIVDPPADVENKYTTPDIPPPNAPSPVTYVIHKYGVELIIAPETAGFFYIEIREDIQISPGVWKEDWNSASKILTTANRNVILPPMTEGVHRLLFKSIDSRGVYSVEYTLLDITIPPIGVSAITSQVVINTVFLTWTVPTSPFTIQEYIILKNGVEIARQTGTYFNNIESIPGDVTFGIIAVDAAGNRGPLNEVVVTVEGFPDYVVSNIHYADFNIGTKENAFVQNGRLVLPVNLAETYEQHFTTRGWASPQAQVDAGYPLWLEPFILNASYEETFDFNVLVPAGIINVIWSHTVLNGSFNVTLDMYHSADGVAWTGPFHTASTFSQNFRYVKVKLSFTGADDQSLMVLNDLRVSLSLRKEMDGGESTSYATDTDGTIVNFNKTFFDIDSITIAPISTVVVVPVVEFVDIPNPTFFKVRIFAGPGFAGGTSPGDRVTCDFRWDARGVASGL